MPGMKPSTPTRRKTIATAVAAFWTVVAVMFRALASAMVVYPLSHLCPAASLSGLGCWYARPERSDTGQRYPRPFTQRIHSTAGVAEPIPERHSRAFAGQPLSELGASTLA